MFVHGRWCRLRVAAQLMENYQSTPGKSETNFEFEDFFDKLYFEHRFNQKNEGL